MLEIDTIAVKAFYGLHSGSDLLPVDPYTVMVVFFCQLPLLAHSCP